MPSPFRSQAALAVAGVAFLLIALAYSRGGASPPSAGAGNTGSTYVEAMVGAPRFVNPLLAVSDSDRDLTHLVYSGLSRVDERGELVPDLASGWEAGPDASVYTFTLKPGLRWHDGEPLTADDLLFTIDLLRSPDFPGDKMLAEPWRAVSKVSVTPQEQIVFTLSAPDASFPQYTTLGILPRHLWGEIKPSDMVQSPLNIAPVGSGPWRYRRASSLPNPLLSVNSDTPVTSAPPAASLRSETDEGVLLEPSPYLAPATGSIKRIWFRLYPTFGAALTGFRQGEFHGLGHIPQDRMQEVEQIESARLHRQPLARYTMLLLNTRSPLFDRRETRQALELAIDREGLVKGPMGGEAVAAVSPVLAHSWAYDSSQASRAHDPARSAALLDAAGWKLRPDGLRARDGVTMTVVLAANEEIASSVEMAKAMERSLRQVGVDVKLALVDRERLLRDYLGPRAFHVALVGWEAEGADPDLSAYWHSSRADVTGGLNFSGWSNPAADKALQEARTTTDRQARKRLYAEFQKAFREDVPAVILCTPMYAYATRSSAQGVYLPETDLLDPAQRFDTIERWSLEPD